MALLTTWTDDVTARRGEYRFLVAPSRRPEAIAANPMVVNWVRLGGKHIIRLEVQGILDHRDVALRTVSAACRLPFRDAREDSFQEFRTHVVSAVGEAFNNIALHGYRNRAPGLVSIEVAATHDQLSIELTDYGVTFDPRTLPAPDLESMPESGLGVFIIRSFMDDVEYTPGPPNVLKLTKRVSGTNGKRG